MYEGRVVLHLLRNDHSLFIEASLVNYWDGLFERELPCLILLDTLRITSLRRPGKIFSFHLEPKFTMTTGIFAVK